MSGLPLDPRGAIAAHFRGDPARDVFRRLRIGSARCDLGDQGLYLAEEIARLDFGAHESDHPAIAALVLAAQIAARGGASRLRSTSAARCATRCARSSRWPGCRRARPTRS